MGLSKDHKLEKQVIECINSEATENKRVDKINRV